MRYKVQTLNQFLVKLKLYINHGYTRYAVRFIPEGKDLDAIDQKLIKTYEVTYHGSSRARRRALGVGNVVYVRFGYMFVLLADELPHPTFDKIDSLNFNDEPLRIDQYSVGMKQERAKIRIASMRLKTLKEQGQFLALKELAIVERFLKGISLFTYEEINQQRWILYKKINQCRQVAGLELVRWDRVSNLKTFPR